MKHLCRLTCVALAAAAAANLTPAQTQKDQDEQVLKTSKLPTDVDGLISFFEKRSLKEGQAPIVADLVRKLGSEAYRIREPAYQELVHYGPKAIPFLKSALASKSLEMRTRAETGIEEIEKTMQLEPIAAAARVLAQRKPERAAEVLANFVLSVSNDPFLEEEILGVIGKLTIRPGKVDPLILKALKDPLSHRRAVAVYLLGRRGDVEHREQLRAHLADPDALVARRVGEGILGKQPYQVLNDAFTADAKLLREEKIELTETGVLKYFRDLTLDEKEQARLRKLVNDLGSNVFTLRVAATKHLLTEKTKALPFLKQADFSSTLEVHRRKEFLMEEIRRATNTAVPIAAAHWLARPLVKQDSSPAEAIRTLLAYIPFADDESVEEEVLTALTILSLREPALDPELLNSLRHPMALRRGAAAYVVGLVGARDDVARLRGMLDDDNPIVRLRATQGLLAARDKAALPTLVQLVQHAPPVYLDRVEMLLHRLAADQGPTEPIGVGTLEARQKATKAWEKWLAANDAKIDLARLNESDAHLGLFTICEYDSQIGNITGQVWETNRNNAKRFTFQGVMGAMDAHTLPNGRVLVAENNANRVTERDSKGAIVWSYQVPANPICCQRLPNGNTFIASYQLVMEVRPDKTEVYRYMPPNFYCFSAHKAKNGNIVAITAQGQIIELDSKNGQQINSVQTLTQGNWCSVELQPNGNYLVASMNSNSVREIDRKGTEVWSKPFNQAFRATKLPNGNVLVCGMNTRQVAEMDRAGNIRWSVNTAGRPWSIHYR